MKIKIDNLGRILIPKAARTALDIKKNDELTLDLTNDEIVIKKSDEDYEIYIMIRVVEGDKIHLAILNDDKDYFNRFYSVVSEYSKEKDETRIIELLSCRVKNDLSYEVIEVMEKVKLESEKSNN